MFERLLLAGHGKPEPCDAKAETGRHQNVEPAREAKVRSQSKTVHYDTAPCAAQTNTSPPARHTGQPSLLFNQPMSSTSI
jgi:hypothetical protein